MTASQSPTPRRRALLLTAALGCAALLVPTFAGCGSPAPVIPQGAWAVSWIQPSLNCQIANHNNHLGEVSAEQRTKLWEDGQESEAGNSNSVIDVSCSVITSGSGFTVDAYEAGLGMFLSISVPELAKNATKDNPSKGIVSYQSPQTANSFSQSDCDFYFLPNTSQGVSEGQVFVTFTCSAIAAASDNICSIDPGYVAFEKCSVKDEEGG